MHESGPAPRLRPCPACASNDATPLGLREVMFASGERFDYATCLRCGTLFIAEIPSDLARYYDADHYYSFAVDPQTLLGNPRVRPFAARVARSAVLGRGVLASALRHVPREQLQFLLTALRGVRLAGLPDGAGTRVLDLGCGTGLLAYALSLGGVREVIGSDPFAPGDREFDTGARVVARELADLDGSFGLIMSHHGFEHVPDPLETLQEMLARLAPDGRILIRTPTVSSFAYERYGADWAQLDPPRHLTILSREGMALLCERAGCTISAVRDDASSFQFWASEQVQAGQALVDQRPATSWTQRRAWARASRRLNRAGHGDQAAWVLRRA